MSAYSIISIVMYSLAGVLFLTAIVVFFVTDVWASIKYLSSKDKFGGDSIPVVSSNIARQAINAGGNINGETVSHSISMEPRNIEYAQQTIDTDELDNQPLPGFETQDWDLPQGVSFVLTKNIIVVHSDKEYIARENI